MTVSALSAVQSLFGGTSAASTTGSSAASGAAASGSFLDMIDSALRGVSHAEDAAAAAQSGYSVGAAGATLGKALVASDRAQVAWNATVAVRNEIVSAYQSVMSMQF